ncbi:Transcriptional regulator containing GAF, AAA-type ATPase, and DNA-binding Fis domains [Desulfatibacillum alkenivorans DSM 16219]|jgi:transcriptional regulator with GAF, ATPase, and Fis domain|uniref:Transcriptional regulator containing GAF, AAA-type ATPase, and DNA-binding Fis domains n=1 Tax=Desulfatibacillum alkenivorans DSM 16219 TaxID=1121393 RepID=A0A1M6XNN8_9BACT|nr:sigma 54-interacting transcriptional regulator [Desulfatibacillum alkenivorans]SHL07622.1 Transcriptional regulator containing GAF, AAA-type ATPase, and DNA-binding Fis domains [Desulfatibacillum alkenivorans DSM 16219]
MALLYDPHAIVIPLKNVQRTVMNPSELEKQNRELKNELERLRSHQSQDEELLRFERLLSEISTQLIGCTQTDIQKPIELGLKLMADFLDVDQVVILEKSSASETKSRYGYRRDNHPFLFPQKLSNTFPYAKKMMDAGEVIVFTNLPHDIPPEAEIDRASCIKYGFKAVLGVPLKVGDAVMGSVICYSFSQPRTWSEGLVQRLRLFGEMVANSINRHRAEVKLQELNKQLQAENLYLKEEIGLKQSHPDIVGKSRAIIRVLKLVEQVAETDSTVLITGETGTGKELVAHAVHRLSKRKNRAMVILNCAALPPNLVESELFGHEKGAFTGALSRRIGRFETAHGSTIFLDEIDSLSLEMQAKLLRVLQQGTFERLGGASSMKVDVRVIAATNKNLAEEISKGSFREDLFYRLNVFPITVPPLRKRPEDIPLLVREFVKTISRQMGRKIDTIPQKSMEMLKRQPWPGNVRELQNVIERAIIISSTSTLSVPRLVSSPGDSKEVLTLDDVQRRHIIDVLENTGWRLSGSDGAAKLLDINPKTLESRMKKLGVHRPNKAPQ